MSKPALAHVLTVRAPSPPAVKRNQTSGLSADKEHAEPSLSAPAVVPA
ncbi:MAG: hypothetical protein GY715_02700 [Planctomycetes bacterium]|nr:hypothetical protein [Planctomycetota bacterium]